MGKGRRERVLPLWKETTAALNAWIHVRQANGTPELFHNAGGRAMTRAGFEYILDKHVSTAGKDQLSIVKKRVTPHVLRHSCAMHILQATGDCPASTTFPCQRQLFFPIDDNYKLGKMALLSYTGADRGRG